MKVREAFGIYLGITGQIDSQKVNEVLTDSDFFFCRRWQWQGRGRS